MNISAVPVVENEKPIGYISLRGIFDEIFPHDLAIHSDAISKNPGHLEITHRNLVEKFQNQSISDHIRPLEAFVETDDPVIKAVGQLLEHNLPIIAVTENDRYLGFIYFKIIAEYFYKAGTD